MADRFAYSHDGEEYWSGGETREQAIAELDGRHGYVAPIKPAAEIVRGWPSGLARLGEDVAERLADWLSDEIGGDEPIVELTDEQKAELGEAIVAFLEKRNAFRRFGLGKAEEVPADPDAGDEDEEGADHG